MSRKVINVNRIRILYVHHGYGIGGAPLSLLYLLQQLPRHRFEPVVLCLHDGPAADLYRREGIETHVNRTLVDFSHTNLHWYRLTHPGDWKQILRLVWRYRATIKATRCFLYDHPVDLVHLNSSSLVPCAVGARQAGVPVVWHIREPLAFGYFGLRRKFIQRAIYQYANRVIAICENDADQLIRDDRVRIVYNFVNFKQFDRNLPRSDFRQELGLDDHTPLVAMLGGVSKTKGTLPFVQALPAVKNAIPTVKFLVVGSTGGNSSLGGSVKQTVKKIFGRFFYSERVFDFIRRHNLSDSVIFTGVRQDIPHLLAAVDVLVFPSTTPHFARPIIEAGAMAKPVVASNLGGPQELVRHGETGFLVPPNDPDALAKAVVTILTNPTLAQQMGEAGYEQAKSRFDAKVNVAQTLAVYEELLG
ncbi:glycosyltransferase family 1 protein [Candidatus Parcubacteria bacterium]|nr:MAG: glycosyltransferase family 1 protein [Candidatus Parcubacteria bacterium]